MAQEYPDQFNMKDLFIDVKLEACVDGTTFDFLGRKLFSTEFFREGVGFGITSIDIEINTSLQPIVTVVFKDMYGLTIFGGQDRHAGEDGQSSDYSVLFNWPPPKFLFSFKGYLGKPATWLLNLKRTTTSFNSSDGSYEIKCEFVPNQWGFFADLPFLYLLAAKRLRKDKLGPEATSQQKKAVISVFDLIKIGKQVEIKTQDTTREFDDLSKQLGSIKSNFAGSIAVTNILDWGGILEGSVNNQPIKDFIKMEMPKIDSLPSEINEESKIEEKLFKPEFLQTLNSYLLLTIKFNGKDGFTNSPRDYAQFSSALNGGNADAINADKANALAKITTNMENIDKEIQRRVFATSEKKLEKITIGEIFSQLAKDSGFIMGSIIDSGLTGYLGNSDRSTLRDNLSDRLIGNAFPMALVDGEEVPATRENLSKLGSIESTDIGVDEIEMAFVNRFISAVSEGIAKDLLATNPQNGEDDSKLKQRINNMEMSSGNPYKPYYSNIATNILVRGGITAYFTRSDDPNRPGDYDTTFGGDRDDIQSIEEVADRDMQNITPTIIKTLSDVDFLLLKRFANFFSRFFSKDAEYIAYAGGGSFAGSNGLKISQSVIGTAENWEVVTSNPNAHGEGDKNALAASQVLNQGKIEDRFKSTGVEVTTFNTIWNELYQPKLLTGYEIVGEDLVNVGEYAFAESTRDEVSGDGPGSSNPTNTDSLATIKNAQNPLSFVDDKYTASRIVNNGIAYAFPYPISQANTYFAVFFRGDDNKRAQEANTAPSDSELKSSDKDAEDAGQNEPLGYIPINSKYGDEGDQTEKVDNGKFMLKRIGSLMGYRDGTSASSGGNVFDFDKCKNPPPAFYGLDDPNAFPFSNGLGDLIWSNSILDSPSDTGNPSNGPVDYTGNIGWTVCAHLGTDTDSGLVFNLFDDTTSSRNHRAYVRKCAEVLADKIKKIEDERAQIIGEVLGKAGESQNLIYKQMHTLYHQWQTLAYSDKTKACGSPIEGVSNVAEELERRFGNNHTDLMNSEKVCISETAFAEGVDFDSADTAGYERVGDKICFSLDDQTQAASVPDGTFIYDYPLQRIHQPEEPINVRDAIINLEPLYGPNGNTTVLNIIQQVCTKNNFLFIPIPGNPGYLNVKDIYSPSRELADIKVRNFFHVLFTPTPESRTKTKNTDGTPLGYAGGDKQRTYDVNSFVIKYGHPDNQIVSNINVGTDENKVTAESIVNLQRLVDNENQNKKVTTDCSMLPVLAGRSYKATVDMLGNSQCYPMQFFFLENSPLFGGLYQIMKVKHAIDPNNMTTSMEGIRMRFSPGDGYGAVKPITLQTFRDLGSSEAPVALGKGFDSAMRDSLKTFIDTLPPQGTTGGGSVGSASAADFANSKFKNGDGGGPTALSVQQLPDNHPAFNNSAGMKDLWFPANEMEVGGKLIKAYRKCAVQKGKKEMFKYDGQLLPKDTLSAWIAMKEAAAAENVTLKLNDGWRPFDEQLTLRKKNGGSNYTANQLGDARIANYDPNKALGSSSFSPQTAIPGRSAHNGGTAIDVNTGSKTGRIKSPLNETVYSWMILNAWKYGFVRTVPNSKSNKPNGEEWHWEYRPGATMFQFCSRKDALWYGLPDKLGIPKDTDEINSARGTSSISR